MSDYPLPADELCREHHASVCEECAVAAACEDRDSDIASLRATIERLTAERDEAKRLLDAFPMACRHESPEMAVEKEAFERRRLQAARDGRSIAESRAESAEATIARLAMVVRAASKWRNAAPCSTAFHREGHSCEECEALGEEGAALSSLTPEDRRRAGIEG